MPRMLPKETLPVLAAAVLLVLLGALATAQTSGQTFGAWVASLARDVPSDIIVTTVNGEPLTLRAVVATQGSIQGTSPTPISDADAL